MKIGIIGYGLRAGMIVDDILSYDMGVEVTAITDIDTERIKKVIEEKGFGKEKVAIYTDADEMLSKEELDGVLIGTRCSLHTEMAIKVLKKNLTLFLEKPVSTNKEDLLRLREVAKISKSKVIVSFPLRVTPLIKLVKEIIDSGKIGTIEQVQAVNNVPYGGVYFHDWYRDEEETGGLFLQKATHDFDYINYILELKPVAICAMKSKQIFKGDKKEGLLCKDCDENRSCPESPFILKKIKAEDVSGPMCCFAKDTGNEDSGTAIIRYETGMHVVYSQNFFARKAAKKRGARFLGYKGTLEFDFYTDEVKVYMHDSPRVESYKLDSTKLQHNGGDAALAYNFIKMLQGEEESQAPIESGIISALMSIKAKESAETDMFKDVWWE